MKKKLLVLGLSTLGITFIMQANALNVVNLSKQNSNELNLNSMPLSSFITGSSDTRTVTHKNHKYNLKQLSTASDQSNKVHTRFVQTYNGIPVWGRQVIQHKPKNSFGFSFNSNSNDNKYTGQLVSDLQNDLSGVQPVAGFTKEAALDFAKSIYNNEKNINSATKLIYENEQSELMIFTHGKDSAAKLVYKVSFFVDDEYGNIPSRPNYLIDATTKEIIKNWNGLMHDRVATGVGGNEKIGKYAYGDDMPKLDVRETPRGECFMTNTKVRTVNLKNGYYGAKTYHFPCYESGNDEVNGAYSPVNDAHYYGEQIFNMYHDWYNKAPLNFKLLMRVHYGNNYENAFWNGSSMTFGDGRNYFFPLVSMDVVGHEVSHGYTEQNSNLEYMGQSGGINEAFSDMAGKASEYYTFGNNTWGIGDDITKGDKPLRYMDTPEKDGISIGDARDYYEWLDVHYSSGVFNKAFYLLATTNGWNIKKAFDVFVHANTYYWMPSSDYKDAALGTVYSSEDLGYDQDDIINTFKQVGIECTPEACSIMSKPEPEPDTDNDTDTDGDSDNGSDDDSGDNSDSGDNGNSGEGDDSEEGDNTQEPESMEVD